MSDQYIYRFTPGPRPELASTPEAWTDEDSAIGAAHFDYLKQATEQGVVILAGRSQDGIGPAVVVFQADSEQDAVAFMQADPFVASGLFGAELHPFRVALWSNPEDR